MNKEKINDWIIEKISNLVESFPEYITDNHMIMMVLLFALIMANINIYTLGFG